MERMLLAAGLRSRASFELIKSYITLNRYDRPFQIVWDLVDNYYQRDTNAQFVQPEVLLGLIAETNRNDKHVAQFTEQINEALAVDVSEVNVEQVVLASKKRELGDELAMALTNGRDDLELLEEYRKVYEMTSLDELNEVGETVIDSSNRLALLTEEANRTGLLTLYPEVLNQRLDGGVAGGDHIVVYARPETGKTALCLTMAAGFARQGAFGVYFGNEDRQVRMLTRVISCLVGLTRHQVLDNFAEAERQAVEVGLNNIMLVGLSPGTPRRIEEYIKKYRPRWVVIDQLRNVAMKSDGRVNQLEAAATFAREMAKKYNCVVISVTQAGDSASNKEVLDMGDVDYSNTGIPAQADLMVGMGVNATLDSQNVRMLSLPKNKIGGVHDHFPVRINPFISRITSPR